MPILVQNLIITCIQAVQIGVEAVFSVGENAYLCVSEILQCGLNKETNRFRSVMLSVVI